MEGLHVRPATVDDAGQLARVYRSAYRENRELGFPAKAESVAPDEVATWIRDSRVFVAIRDGEVIGGVRLEETTPDRVKLGRLAVREELKGRGIGSRLLDHAENAAHDGGYDVVRLTTPPEHPSLPELYRERGYGKTEPYPLDYRDYDEVAMEKRLG